MKLIYVAGPFRAKDSWEIEQNIRRAEEISLAVWRLGVPALCPHTNTRFFQGAAPDDVWLKGDIEMLHRCDAVMLVPGWRNSSGTRAEVAEALRREIPVFDCLEQLRCWLRGEHAWALNEAGDRVKLIPYQTLTQPPEDRLTKVPLDPSKFYRLLKDDEKIEPGDQMEMPLLSSWFFIYPSMVGKTRLEACAETPLIPSRFLRIRRPVSALTDD